LCKAVREPIYGFQLIPDIQLNKPQQEGAESKLSNKKDGSVKNGKKAEIESLKQSKEVKKQIKKINGNKV